MEQQVAATLREYRNSYCYPFAMIEEASTLDIADEPFRNAGMPFKFPRRTQKVRSTIQLESTFTDLLRSREASDQVRGVASVIYWGYQNFSPQYARRRVEWSFSGQKGRGARLGTEAATASIQNAIEAVDANKVGDALRAVGQIAQLSRTPFASKIVAFMKPDCVGIYDSKIKRALGEPSRIDDAPISDWLKILVRDHDIANGVGAVSSPHVGRRFENWCSVLRDVAGRLNELGDEMKWREDSSSSRSWRAIDVERAIFSAAS
jgi:hypothetical protein